MHTCTFVSVLSTHPAGDSTRPKHEEAYPVSLSDSWGHLRNYVHFNDVITNFRTDFLPTLLT